ncbi:prenyltransferase/squalene oxidase repeat-containing protein [Blastococcus sp. Marseille-P5729]|uniref:prenyltransferase/squalene oxidase repeat-containing protein n=1 Tax=Blastococcus sp. Marseille-P5729 TaxID=2086582 RepID=UPI00131BDB65|nr:prenyltransferase/squalene oxidase repeat-containing protein [Blastococcus sp. Marseille-P5729]
MGIRTLCRAGTAAVTGLLAMTLLAPSSAYADPAYGGATDAEAAAAYLAAQLADGDDHLSSEFEGDSFPDHGLTLDAVLALDAAGVAQDQADASTKWLAANIADYVGTGGETYANAAGKALFFAAARGENPTSFGGLDLVALVTSTEGAREPGRYSDISSTEDYSNNIGQSFAILGLSRAGAAVNEPAVQYLRSQQCGDGGFQLAPTGGECLSDPDATAMAVQALIAVAGADDDDVTEGLDYLAATQREDGGFGGGSTTEGPNANSTGLAAAALTAGGRTEEAGAAHDYLAALQHTCTSGETDLTGVVSYDQAGYDAAQQDGPVDQDARATAQAVMGLADTSLLTVTAGGDATTPQVSCAAEGAAASESGADTEDGEDGAAQEPGGTAGYLTAVGLVVFVSVGLLVYTIRRPGTRS